MLNKYDNINLGSEDIRYLKQFTIRKDNVTICLTPAELPAPEKEVALRIATLIRFKVIDVVQADVEQRTFTFSYH